MALFGFAAAMPPRCEQLFPTDRWLAAIHAAGYTHLCLQNDPFFHPEMDLRVWGEHMFRLLGLFDLIAGPRARSYQAWLAAVAERAGRHGLQLALQLWEPRLTQYARRILPADWKGPAWRGIEPLCVGHQPARSWLLDSFAHLFAIVPNLDTLILGVNDNQAILCPETCPRCGGKTIEQRLGRLYEEIRATCARVRPDVRIVLYDWFWSPGTVHSIREHFAGPVAILTRLERDSLHIPDPDHPEWAGHIFDMSVGWSNALGPDFRAAAAFASATRGDLLVMLPLSGMFEAFELPYVPAVSQLAAKFDRMRTHGVRGWVDYDCGGIHEGLVLDLVRTIQHNPDKTVEEWLAQLAEERYGGSAAPVARQIWERFDAAVRALPTILDVPTVRAFSGRFGVAMGLVPSHPFLAERAAAGRDAGHEFFWFDPHNFLVPEAIPAVRHLMARALAFVREAPALFGRLAPLADPDRRANVEKDALIAELSILNWQSIANFYAWAAAIQGDATIGLEQVIQEEIAVTRRYRELAARPELEVGNMTWGQQRMIAGSAPWVVGDGEHAAAVLGLTDRWPDPPAPGVAGDPFAWKIAALEAQLAALRARTEG